MPARPDPLLPFFKERNWKPFAFQKETWQAYAAGKSGLLHAPTGLGKTLAVWLGPVREALLKTPAAEAVSVPLSMDGPGRKSAGLRPGSAISAGSAAAVEELEAGKDKAKDHTAARILTLKAAKTAPSGCRVLWLTPLRALAADTL